MDFTKYASSGYMTHEHTLTPVSGWYHPSFLQLLALYPTLGSALQLCICNYELRRKFQDSILSSRDQTQ